jgi:hypothetical protein
MPHRQLIKAESLRMAGLIVHSNLISEPEKFPIRARGWATELREVSVENGLGAELVKIFEEQIREIKGAS